MDGWDIYSKKPQLVAHHGKVYKVKINCPTLIISRKTADNELEGVLRALLYFEGKEKYKGENSVHLSKIQTLHLLCHCHVQTWKTGAKLEFERSGEVLKGVGKMFVIDITPKRSPARKRKLSMVQTSETQGKEKAQNTGNFRVSDNQLLPTTTSDSDVANDRHDDKADPDVNKDTQQEGKDSQNKRRRVVKRRQSSSSTSRLQNDQYSHGDNCQMSAETSHSAVNILSSDLCVKTPIDVLRTGSMMAPVSGPCVNRNVRKNRQLFQAKQQIQQRPSNLSSHDGVAAYCQDRATVEKHELDEQIKLQTLAEGFREARSPPAAGTQAGRAEARGGNEDRRGSLGQKAWDLVLTPIKFLFTSRDKSQGKVAD